jgi:hypothetical protein
MMTLLTLYVATVTTFHSLSSVRRHHQSTRRLAKGAPATTTVDGALIKMQAREAQFKLLSGTGNLSTRAWEGEEALNGPCLIGSCKTKEGNGSMMTRSEVTQKHPSPMGWSAPE